MQRFAERTGVTSDRPQRRYLWTDAFAVCNFLGLWRATGDAMHREVALRLVDQVHQTSAATAPMTCLGWISGLPGRKARRTRRRRGQQGARRALVHRSSPSSNGV
jgi:hypothetical protein